jgi:hypothetical protein
VNRCVVFMDKPIDEECKGDDHLRDECKHVPSPLGMFPSAA